MTFINSGESNNNDNYKEVMTSGVEIIATSHLDLASSGSDDDGSELYIEDNVFDKVFDNDEDEDEEVCNSTNDQASKTKTFFGVDAACGSCSRKNIVLGALAGGLLLLVLVSGTAGMVQSKFDQQVISSSAAVVDAAKAPKAKTPKAPKGGGGGGGGECDRINRPLSCFEYAVDGYCRDAQGNSYSHVAFVAPLAAGIYNVGNLARICFECVHDEVPVGTFRGFEYSYDPPVGYCLYDYEPTFDYTVSGSCKDCSDYYNRGIEFVSSDTSGRAIGQITQSDGSSWTEALCYRLKE